MGIRSRVWPAEWKVDYPNERIVAIQTPDIPLPETEIKIPSISFEEEIVEPQSTTQNQICTDVDYAWAAGFFEGEGCISITKDYTLHVRVSQVDREPLDRLKTLFHGNIRNKCALENRKRCHEWSICNALVVDFLLAIQKFVVRTRVTERIRLAIEFQHIKTDRTSPRQERRNQMEAAYSTLKQLNKAGRVDRISTGIVEKQQKAEAATPGA